MHPTIFTIGHSTRAIDEFIALLKENGVKRLVDIRTIPRSRFNPQYNQQTLEKSLAGALIEYRHIKALGGMRKARADSPNTGFRNGGFRGYADYMPTKNFKEALHELIEQSHEKPLAIMCAESVPWRCHRSLVSDALTVRQIPVMHIMGEGNAKPHSLTSFAHVEEEELTYPPAEALLL